MSGTIPLININATTIFGNNNTIGGARNRDRNLYMGCYNPHTTSQNMAIYTEGSTVVTGNTIGLTAAGNAAPATGSNNGIFTIGGPFTFTNNVIAGHNLSNLFLGILMEPAGPIIITNNYIGTDVTGSINAGNNGIGISTYPFFNIPSNLIISENVMSGNTYGAVIGLGGLVSLTGAQLLNNIIGLDATGSIAIPNTQDGIWLQLAVNTVVNNNIISANGGNGIRAGKDKNSIIKGNIIGADVTGTLPFGNGLNGIQLGATVTAGVPSFGDVVGGALAGEGNFIAYNNHNGIAVVSYTQEETIIGNTIINNKLNGIFVGPHASTNWIGGFRTAGNLLLAGDLESQGYTNLGPLGTSNVINGNGESGIKIACSNNNKIQANIIGQLGSENGSNGVTIENGSRNLVGGKLALPATELPPLGNVISNNNGYGVLVSGCKAVDNAITTNSISDNQKNSIELSAQK